MNSTQARGHRPSKRRTGAQATPAHRLRPYCGGCDKYSYIERKHAKDEKRRLAAADPSGVPLAIYRCPSGSGHWHIGHDVVRHEDTRRYYLGHGVGMEER